MVETAAVQCGGVQADTEAETGPVAAALQLVRADKDDPIPFQTFRLVSAVITQ